VEKLDHLLQTLAGSVRPSNSLTATTFTLMGTLGITPGRAVWIAAWARQSRAAWGFLGRADTTSRVMRGSWRGNGGELAGRAATQAAPIGFADKTAGRSPDRRSHWRR